MAKAAAATKTVTKFEGLEQIESIPTTQRSGRTAAMIAELSDLKKGKSVKIIDFTATPNASTAYGAARSLRAAADKAGLTGLTIKVVNKVVYASKE